MHIPWNNIFLQKFHIDLGLPVLMPSPGLLVIPCAIGTVNKQKKVKERAAMVPATARDDQPTDNMI